MEGTVHAINPENDIVAIDTRTGYSILEQTGNDFDVGDHVTWTPDRAIGAASANNVSRGRTARVYFRNHGVPGTFLKVNLEP